MRTAVINALALFVLPVTIANALTLYEDPATGQVFTKPAEGRVQIDSFPGTEQADATARECRSQVLRLPEIHPPRLRRRSSLSPRLFLSHVRPNLR